MVSLQTSCGSRSACTLSSLDGTGPPGGSSARWGGEQPPDDTLGRSPGWRRPRSSRQRTEDPKEIGLQSASVAPLGVGEYHLTDVVGASRQADLTLARRSASATGGDLLAEVRRPSVWLGPAAGRLLEQSPVSPPAPLPDRHSAWGLVGPGIREEGWVGHGWGLSVPRPLGRACSRFTSRRRAGHAGR